MSDEPIIESEVVEEDGAGVELARQGVTISVPPPATLFRTDDPVLIVEKATAVANALARVLREKQLVSAISGKEYVRVEGWTLCGTMLGVFPVCEWTRKLDNGWEARVEARTITGAVVGAAEAECLTSERSWSGRDDYAIRSMAQTRATSKALRQPLGFIVQLAGFEATPAEEIPPEKARSPEPVRRAGPGGYPVPTSWPKVKDAFRACDNPEESEGLYEAFLKAATYHLYGQTSLKEIPSADRKVMLQKAGGAACWLHDTDAGIDGPFRFFLEDNHRAAWASVLEGAALEIPDYVPPEPPLPEAVQEEADRIAAEVFSEGS